MKKIILPIFIFSIFIVLFVETGLIEAGSKKRPPKSEDLSGVNDVPLYILDKNREKLKQFRQILIVYATEYDSHKATAYMYERSNGRWSLAFLPKSAIIGHKGFAGIDMKKEGDGKTPSGIYTLGTAFGYGKTVETGLPYRQTGKNDFWVDDPKSKQYNKWINGKPKAASFEKMKRKDDLYKLGIVIHYNMAPIIRGKGSAIFIHIWSPNGSATTGCISLSERDVREILEWLKKSNNPGIIMGVARDLISLLPHGVGQQ